jgi:hypothetical protein
MADLDAVLLTIGCEHCRARSPQSIGALCKLNSASCDYCGAAVDIDIAQLSRAREKAEPLFFDFLERLKSYPNLWTNDK